MLRFWSDLLTITITILYINYCKSLTPIEFILDIISALADALSMPCLVYFYMPRIISVKTLTYC